MNKKLIFGLGSLGGLLLLSRLSGKARAEPQSTARIDYPKIRWEDLADWVSLTNDIHVPADKLLSFLARVTNTGSTVFNAKVQVSIGSSDYISGHRTLSPGAEAWLEVTLGDRIIQTGIHTVILKIKDNGRVLDSIVKTILVQEAAPVPEPVVPQVHVFPIDDYYQNIAGTFRNERLEVSAMGGLRYSPTVSMLKFRISDIPENYSYTSALLRLYLYNMPFPGNTHQTTQYWCQETLWGEDTSLNMGVKDLDITDKLPGAINHAKSVGYHYLEIGLSPRIVYAVDNWQKFYASSRYSERDYRPRLVLIE